MPDVSMGILCYNAGAEAVDRHITFLLGKTLHV